MSTNDRVIGITPATRMITNFDEEAGKNFNPVSSKQQQLVGMLGLRLGLV